MTDLGAQLAARLLASDPDRWADILLPDGSARHRQWMAEDGWLVVYTTERAEGGPWAGKFVVMTYRPQGKGARTGKARQWVRNYARAYATRKAAKARAVALYRQHSPRWAASHPA